MPRKLQEITQLLKVLSLHGKKDSKIEEKLVVLEIVEVVEAELFQDTEIMLFTET